MGEEGSRLERRLALHLSLVAFLFFLLFQHGHFASTDEINVYEATRSLYEHGSLEVPKGQMTSFGRGGRIYNHFGVGQSMAALPFYGMGVVVDALLPDSWRGALAGPDVRLATLRWGGTIEIFAVSLYAPVASAALAAIFFFWQRRLGASARAAAAATIFVATTTYVAMMSVYFLQHTTEALLVLGAFLLFHEFARDSKLRALALGSLSASLILLVRIAGVVAWPGLAGYLGWALWRGRGAVRNLWPRVVAASVLPFVLVLFADRAVNYLKWASWIASPRFGYDGFHNPVGVGLAGFLFSPGCSIFVYTPLLLLAPAQLVWFWRRNRPECATILAIFVCSLMMYAHYDWWTGLWSSPGPRYLFTGTVLLLLPLGPWLDAHRGRLARGLTLVLAAIGLWIQLVLMSASWPAVIATMKYKEWSAHGFLFVADQSPILGSAYALSLGWVDPWLWNLAAGWAGQPGRPIVAGLLFVVWAIAFGAVSIGARRTLARLVAVETR